MANIRRSRAGGFIRGGRSRRESLWIGVAPASNVLAGASNAVLSHTLNAAALALRPFTVVRSRILWHVKSDQTGALEDYFAGFGVAVISDQAAAIGITAVPTPMTDISSDLWFVYEQAMSQFLFISGVGVDPNAGVLTRVDSKAMRKVEDGQDIGIVQENSGIFAGGSTNTVSGRFLVKLH